MRPALLGVSADIDDSTVVAQVLRALAGAWGGCYCAVLPHSLSPVDVDARFFAHDLDSIWSWGDAAVDSSVKESRSQWRGAGEWGPFGEGRYHHGLIPWQALQGAPQDIDGHHDPLLDWFLAESNDSPVHHVHLEDVPSATQTRSLNHSPPMILLLDRQSPRQQVMAWNIRSTSTHVAMVDDENGQREVEWTSIVDWCLHAREEDVDEIREIWVWDVRENQAGAVPRGIAEAIEQVGVKSLGFDVTSSPPRYARVLETDIKTSYDVTMPYGHMQATVALPRLPLAGRGGALGDYRTVAADVRISEVTGEDPRLVARVPNDMRFADLLDYVSDGVVRLRRPTEQGFVAGVSAADHSIKVQLHRKSEIFRRLFGADAAVVTQSDVGLFQTRASEMLGGAASGSLTQPGLAAALRLLTSHPGGVPLPRLRTEVENNRGQWPGMLSRINVSDYVDSVLRFLLNSGMVRAVLQSKCTYCRAQMQLDPDVLSNSVSCDFCGQEVRLAPMIGWGSPKWLFRLAGHLTEAQVQAMIPALATLGQVSHLVGVRGGVACHELGLTVSVAKRSVEADIAAFLPHPIPVTLLGEVKSRNRIDQNDVSNLEWLQDLLTDNGFDSLIIFATTKERFGGEEVELLRRHCEARARLMSVRRATTPRLPLLLAGEQLFLPWIDEKNVGRWGRASPALAIHGTALESCKRNLGLLDWGVHEGKVELTWQEDDD